ncbi:hypothetical protein DQ384_22090 [Sphaerisporangium album]|uniref:Uncharacterized protein n=1 Tax=Sphaerisporangium album TaxID=509200 RepID=A0A367FF80_9ACTN|nr:DUF6412 domain-containing protein [Sphaerisporangium album]RCG29038.1 hypothetical protein DQ384_22090 [Sphaerisporangium album]
MTVFHATVALLAQFVAGQSGPAALTAVGLVGVTLLVLAWALGRLASIPAVAPTGAGRPRAARPVFVRLCHPDTAGRPRPRAPSAGPAPV